MDSEKIIASAGPLVPAIHVARGPQTELAELKRKQAQHPFWDNRLFKACTNGWLSSDDLKFVFGQYSHYSHNFTRLIAAVMTNCDNDLFRAQLSENLWEEGGGCEPEKRHAEIFRKFLREVFDIHNPERTVAFEGFTRHFVREYMVFCLRANPIEASAFLSLGTEGIVAKMYSVFVEGMVKAGIDDGKLEFFHIH